MARIQRLDPVWYRLLVRVPTQVVFPSATFSLRISRDEYGSWLWSLRASNRAEATESIVSEDFKTEEWLREALFKDGFATRHATVGETIMERMVRTGAAERLKEPLRPPEHERGWPWMWV